MRGSQEPPRVLYLPVYALPGILCRYTSLYMPPTAPCCMPPYYPVYGSVPHLTYPRGVPGCIYHLTYPRGVPGCISLIPYIPERCTRVYISPSYIPERCTRVYISLFLIPERCTRVLFPFHCWAVLPPGCYSRFTVGQFSSSGC